MSSSVDVMERAIVRSEAPADVAAIRQLHEAAFGRPEEGRIVDALRDTPDWIKGGSMVAEAAGLVVGHVLLSRGRLIGENVETEIWMLGPIAVLPDRQGMAIGGRLMEAAIAFASGAGQGVLCLLGHAGYYPRFGFEPARALGIEPPEPWPDESWMALRLPAWSPTLRGVAHFPSAFGV